MIIFTCASRFFGDQISRIDYGLRELGHEVNTDQYNIDLIYANDAEHYSDALYLFQNNPDAKLILNVLDVPDFLPNIDNIKQEWAPKLKQAHKITAISDFTKKKIKEHFDVDAHVIYNPIKNIYPLENVKKDIKFLFVGRASAPNKRVKEIIWPLYKAIYPYFGEDCLHFVGSENVGFGVYEGIIDDNKLNELYNRSVFCLIPSKWEGQNLPMLESVASETCIPIICKDMTTAFELGVPQLLCEPNADGMIYKIKQVLDDIPYFLKILLEYGPIYREKFSGKSVAQRILSVYDSIK